MRGIQIYLADTDYNGTIVISSTSSQIAAIRVEKARVSDFSNELLGPGIYFLLIGSDSVYVGQTGLDTLQKRIMNTHTGNIDSSWHTVVGFKFSNSTISSNELQFIENAMCEYAHANFSKCLTTSPAKTTCNEQFRKQHYHLSSGQIHSCNQYIEDIKHYLKCFPNTIFPEQFQKKDAPPVLKFRLKDATMHMDGKLCVVEQGSRITGNQTESFIRDSRYKTFLRLQEERIIVDGVFVKDYEFTNSSAPATIILGNPANGKDKWRTDEGKPLKDYI